MSASKRSDLRVIDGGLATELERRGFDVSGPLWSAAVLSEAPHAIEQLHYDYFAAGADVAITASYQASHAGFAALGLNTAETNALLRSSVSLAQSARQRFEDHCGERRGLSVAASVGPYGATLHDGSEYHGNYGLSVEQLIAFHAERFGILAESGADLLACETVPSLDEARALAHLLRNHSKCSAWVSFTSRDGHRTSHGEPLQECASFLDSIENVVAIGVNCVAPRIVTEAVRQLRAGTGKPIVVYPNSGEHWNAEDRQWAGDAGSACLADLVSEWIDTGARWIGGCCRTGPQDIAALRRRISRG